MAIKSSLCKIARNDRKAMKAKRFQPSTRPSLQDSQTSPASAGKSLTQRRIHPSTRPSLQDAAAPAVDRARAAARDCARNTRDDPADRPASTPGAARPSSVGPAPGSSGSPDRSPAWLAASGACARAGTPSPHKTAGQELADVAGTSGRTMRTGGTPWMAPDRRTFHSVPNNARRRCRRALHGRASAYSRRGSNPVSRGWVNFRER